MHIVAAWVTAFNFLNMVTTFCSLESWNIKNGSSNLEYVEGLNQMPAILSGKYLPDGKPKESPRGLKPLLTKDLSLEHVTELWKSASPQIIVPKDDDECDANATKCPFSWLSGISSTLNNPTKVEEYFRQHTMFSGEWTFQDDHGKLGIVPRATGSTMTIELPQTIQLIRKVTVFYMKSYGEKWTDSKVRVQCFQKRQSANNNDSEWEVLQQTSIAGSHEKYTSETYQQLLDLSSPPIEPGAALRIEATLLDGSTFKILGVAICS